MKIVRHYLCILLSLWMGNVLEAQVANYNQYPLMHAETYVETATSNMSFAYSMRRLFDDYSGPLVRLRRASDNAEQDFYTTDSDLIDNDAINSWAGGSTVHLKIWYDQSGKNRNAVQNNNGTQPTFYTDPVRPYFRGLNRRQYLVVQNGSIQVVTNNGKQGTVLFVLRATRNNQNSFGVLSGRNRWSAHTNWSNQYFYFDPGYCCYGNRNFSNVQGQSAFMQYTVLAGSNNTLMRQNGVTMRSGGIGTQRCTLTANFGIGAALRNGDIRSGNASDSYFTELIMFNTDIASSDYDALEQNQMSFWGL